MVFEKQLMAKLTHFNNEIQNVFLSIVATNLKIHI